jgi:hypothetical protein
MANAEVKNSKLKLIIFWRIFLMLWSSITALALLHWSLAIEDCPFANVNYGATPIPRLTPCYVLETATT